jgi:hypothetical protein
MIALAPDEVSDLMRLFPAAERPRDGVIYDGYVLTAPADVEAQINAILQNPNWREHARARGNRVQLLANAAKRRFTKQTAGIDYHVCKIDTSRESCAALAAIAATAEDGEMFRWKTMEGGFLTLDRLELIALLRAVNAHVQTCFALEREAVAGIASGSITTEEQIATMFEDCLK